MLLTYGGAALGVAVANLLPLLLPQTAGWAATAGIVIGLAMIFSADNEEVTPSGVATDTTPPSAVEGAVSKKDD
jgi:hypothetical protein